MKHIGRLAKKLRDINIILDETIQINMDSPESEIFDKEFARRMANLEISFSSVVGLLVETIKTSRVESDILFSGEINYNLESIMRITGVE
jgi:hypothetical protein